MTFVQSELAFEPGIFSNRSRRASKRRWVDGDLVRFRDGLPAQIGGWQIISPIGDPITGAARGIITFRPNNQNGRFAAIGTSTGAFLYDGERMTDITPAGLVLDDAVGTASSWTFDLFGEVLVGCFSSDGVVYEFTPGQQRLAPVAGAPRARAICVSDERHVFAFGVDGVPGRVAWSDRENRSEWDPAPDNRAGGYDVQVTSPFQCGHRVRGQILGWTASEVFAFAPLSNALVYSREKLATKAGAAGPQAVVVLTDQTGESAYWIGRDNFYIYEGYVRVLDCDLHDYVFGDINLTEAARFHARLNARFDEVWFWFCSAGSTEVDRAVTYNFKLGIWSKASVVRLCWADAGIFDTPLAVDPDGRLWAHEVGDKDADAPMPSFVLSHPITVGVGQQFAEVDQFWPDMQEGSAPCTVSFVCRDAPGGESYVVGPTLFEVGDELVPLSIATREFQLRIGGAGGAWELGVPLISVQGGSLR